MGVKVSRIRASIRTMFIAEKTILILFDMLPRLVLKETENPQWRVVICDMRKLPLMESLSRSIVKLRKQSFTGTPIVLRTEGC